MFYVYIDPDVSVRPLVRDLPDKVAKQHIGQRVGTGFPVVQRFVMDRHGELFSLVYFQSDADGHVWAIYYL